MSIFDIEKLVYSINNIQLQNFTWRKSQDININTCMSTKVGVGDYHFDRTTINDILIKSTC